MLQDADFKPLYASGEDEPSDFFIDGLCNSNYFDLGLGYFRSTGFKSLAFGFASFIQNGGKMRFVINDSLIEKDKTAILNGQQQEESDEDYEQRLINDLHHLMKTLSKRDEHFFNCLSWLIASERLEIKVVVPKKNKVGIVHHKFGIFTDINQDRAVFNGSVNFSEFALKRNVESISCEYSWEAQGMAKIRIDQICSLFEKTWSGQSEAVRIISVEQVKVAIQNWFPKKTVKELISTECDLLREDVMDVTTPKQSVKKLTALVNNINAESEDALVDAGTNTILQNKWQHQNDAIAIFLNEKRGVLNMATGTGKTRTALRICKELIDNGFIQTIIVSCDGVDLLDQWYKELLTLVQKESWLILRHYENYHQSERFRNTPIKKVMLISRQQLHLALGNLSTSVREKTLLIHDEVHKLGSTVNRDKLSGLSNDIIFRLGLSATPEREYDVEGTDFIFDHIGKIIFNFTLEDGIRKGILSPFNYFPIPYSLTTEDKARLRAVYSRKAAAASAGNPMSDEDFWTQLAIVYKTADGKIPAFVDFINLHPEMLKRCIVFVETKEYGKKILDIIHQHHTDFHTYYGGEDPSILTRFATGEIECLLTCHRLSEGIDIQSLQNVILISSARARLETIQRIGRCLRADPKNANKIANVVDFIREGNEDDNAINADQERENFLALLATIRKE
ncbi:MAG: DEAD/DEAH box helicase [Chryseobacterium sp.]|nr:MAG: DEAD/DEAH box helicase [Chryseobacterium sp.]